VLGADIVFGKEMWSFRKQLTQPRSQLVDPLSSERGNQLLIGSIGAQELAIGIGEQVSLGSGDQDRRLQFRYVSDFRQRSRFGVRGFDEVEDDICVTECLERGPAHDLLERDVRFHQSRRIDEHDLGVVEGEDSRYAIARGLGFGAGDGELLADETIKKRGLPHVGFTDDGDES
jgi:hypothetical protein